MIGALKGWALAAVIGLAAAVALAGVAVVKDYGAARKARADYAACEDSAQGKRGAVSPMAACLASIAAHVEGARRAQSCKEGLIVLSDGTWAAPTTCPAVVQGLASEHNARAAEAKSRGAEIDRLRRDHAQALQRAELRGAQSLRRTLDANAALASAPRDDGGLIVLDGERLRSFAGHP